jgi:hypothetical protein
MTGTTTEAPKTFEFPHACVIFGRVKNAEGKSLPSVFIQCVDEYAYQRELSVKPVRTYDRVPREVRNGLEYEVHPYLHPGIRRVHRVSKAVATAFLIRLQEQLEKYPTLLFTVKEGRELPLHRGFVHLHHRLLNYDDLSQKLL